MASVHLCPDEGKGVGLPGVYRYGEATKKLCRGCPAIYEDNAIGENCGKTVAGIICLILMRIQNECVEIYFIKMRREKMKW